MMKGSPHTVISHFAQGFSAIARSESAMSRRIKPLCDSSFSLSLLMQSTTLSRSKNAQLKHCGTKALVWPDS